MGIDCLGRAIRIFIYYLQLTSNYPLYSGAQLCGRLDFIVILMVQKEHHE